MTCNVTILGSWPLLYDATVRACSGLSLPIGWRLVQVVPMSSSTQVLPQRGEAARGAKPLTGGRQGLTHD